MLLQGPDRPGRSDELLLRRLLRLRLTTDTDTAAGRYRATHAPPRSVPISMAPELSCMDISIVISSRWRPFQRCGTGTRARRVMAGTAAPLAAFLRDFVQTQFMPNIQAEAYY